jgi:DNA polymerase
VEGDGPIPCDVMLVGEALGANEEKRGKPFVGGAGKLLNDMIEEAGRGRPEVFITNTTRCRPPGNRDPKQAEINACMLYTARELMAVRPKVVVALGRIAAKTLTGKEGIQDNRGEVLRLKPEYRYDCPVFVTYHPASLMYGDSDAKRAAIVSDFNTAFRATRRSTFEVEVESKQVLRELDRLQEVAVDCEWEVLTEGGSWPWSRRQGRLPRLLSIGIAGEVDGAVVGTAVRHTSPLWQAVRKLLNRAKSTVYHNAPGDLIWLYSAGIRPPLGGDTLMLASLLGLQQSWKLESLASAYADVSPGWKGAVPLGREPLSEEEWLQFLIYNARDACATYPLNGALLGEMNKGDRQRVYPLYLKLLRSIEVMADASLAGIPFDHSVLERLHTNAKNVLQSLREEVSVELNVPGYAVGEPHSAGKVAAALERRGVKLERTAKKDEPSLSRGSLLPYRKKPVVRKLLRISEVNKLENTYIGPWKYLLTQQGNNRLHTAYKLWKARSGRSSAETDKGGTFQQFPRNRKIRRLVKARPGWKIVSADLSTVEMRIAAWLANEPTMKQFFRDGVDVHTATAGWIKALNDGATLHDYLGNQLTWMSRVRTMERQAAKPVNFGFLYGMREATFIEQARRDYDMEFTMGQAEQAREGYFTLYPELVPWHESFWPAVQRREVDTPFGRRRMLTEDEDEQELWRKAINTPVQATASDLALIGMNDTYDELMKEFVWERDFVLFGFVHDAVLLEVRDAVVPQVVNVIRHAMEHPNLSDMVVDIPVPLVADVKVGQTWAEAA